MPMTKENILVIFPPPPTKGPHEPPAAHPPSLVTQNKKTRTQVKVLDHFRSGWQPLTDNSPILSSQLEEQGPYATNKRRTTREVTFNEQVNIYITISLEEISETERRATWYSKGEYKEITQSSCRQIKSLDRGKLFKDKKYCSRGLESHTRMASLTKRRNYTLSHKIVFDEQARQKREGVYEVEYLAYLYHSVSSSCQIWANVVGLSDQRAAEQETQQEDNTLPRSTQTLSQSQRSIAVHHSTTTSPGKIRAAPIRPAARLRIRNIELARAA